MSTSTTKSYMSDIVAQLIWSNKSLTIGELEGILEHRESFEKYIDIMIADRRIQLANFKLRGEENRAYLAIDILTAMKIDMSKSLESFKKMRINQEKEKELKKAKKVV